MEGFNGVWKYFQGGLGRKWPIRPPINQGEVQSLLSALEAPDTQEEIIRGSPTKGSLSKIRTKALDSVHTIAKLVISPTFFVSGDRRKSEENLRRPDRRFNPVWKQLIPCIICQEAASFMSDQQTVLQSGKLLYKTQPTMYWNGSMQMVLLIGQWLIINPLSKRVNYNWKVPFFLRGMRMGYDCHCTNY